jgi:hypothetical protein
MGRGRVRRPGRRAPLLPYRRRPARADAGGAPGGDAAASAYVSGRAATIVARMGAVELP